MKLRRSGEDDLKTILILRDRNGCVRSADVADHRQNAPCAGTYLRRGRNHVNAKAGFPCRRKREGCPGGAARCALTRFP